MLIQIYDPPMCCASGVCGPTVDPHLAQFGADLRWLESRGARVERYNLAQEPGAFAANTWVKQHLSRRGKACLPLILVEGRVASEGRYPTREELAASIEATEDSSRLYNSAVAELVAIGAAVAVNCNACFEYHWQAARKLGVSEEDIAQAVATAETVKRTPVRAMREVVKRHLGDKTRVQQIQAPSGSSCCGSEPVRLENAQRKCC